MSELHTTYTALFRKLQKGISDLTQEEVAEVIPKLEECMELVSSEALFSKNEEIDDVTTESLKYLAMNYLYGKARGSLQKMSDRKANLTSAKEYLQRYLELCKDYGLLDKSELRKVDGERDRPMTAEERRNFKIDKFKRERAAQQRMAEINRLLRLAAPEQGLDYEEEQRELYVLLLQSFIRDAIDDLDLIDDELAMLRMREESLSTSSESAAAAATPSSSMMMPPPVTTGISVTRTFKVGDQLMMSRETVKANVFGMGIEAPSVSLADFGDMQKQEAEERAAREAAVPPGTRKYKELLRDGEEDDDELLDEATMADRAWDDWKDHNPRGIGNKLGKRF